MVAFTLDKTTGDITVSADLCRDFARKFSQESKAGAESTAAVCFVGTPSTMAHCTTAAAVQRSRPCCTGVAKHSVGLKAPKIPVVDPEQLGNSSCQ